MKNIPLLISTFLALVVGVLLGHFVWVSNSSRGNEMMTSQYGSHMMTDGTIMNAQGSVGMEHMMTDMTANMIGKKGKELEKIFIEEMIPHHQGAVDMAKLLLEDKTITNTDLVGFAKSIIKAQESEIATMKTWLKNY